MKTFEQFVNEERVDEISQGRLVGAAVNAWGIGDKRSSKFLNHAGKKVTPRWEYDIEKFGDADKSKFYRTYKKDIVYLTNQIDSYVEERPESKKYKFDVRTGNAYWKRIDDYKSKGSSYQRYNPWRKGRYEQIDGKLYIECLTVTSKGAFTGHEDLFFMFGVDPETKEIVYNISKNVDFDEPKPRKLTVSKDSEFIETVSVKDSAKVHEILDENLNDVMSEEELETVHGIADIIINYYN